MAEWVVIMAKSRIAPLDFYNIKKKTWREPTWTEVEFWNVLNLNF